MTCRVAALLFLSLSAALPAGCGKFAPPGGTVEAPGTEPAETDYPTFRKSFRTNLTRTGPAPQRWEQEPVSPGAVEVTYESDWRKLKAWVSLEATRPGPKKPGVLFLHGGFAFGADDWDQAEPFRKAGFHVMVPILRGENGQGGAFSLHVGEADDALAAAEAFARLPGVDDRNLFVSGHSVGGTLALFCALGSDRFRAAAPISAAPDCGHHLAGQADFAPFDLSDRREVQARSPAAFARHFKCPVRAYYAAGEADFFDPDTRAMANAARDAGRDVQAVRLPGDHMTVVGPAMTRAVALFQEHQQK
jgi:dipeptidyl aminopeptidase/acylaminoacyl peptidase